MNQETYQDYENGMQNLLPMERQMLLAEVYHYCWYSPEAYEELKKFLNNKSVGNSLVPKGVFTLSVVIIISLNDFSFVKH